MMYVIAVLALALLIHFKVEWVSEETIRQQRVNDAVDQLLIMELGNEVIDLDPNYQRGAGRTWVKDPSRMGLWHSTMGDVLQTRFEGYPTLNGMQLQSAYIEQPCEYECLAAMDQEEFRLYLL